MNELARPFVRSWEWVGAVGGFPGQVFAVCAIVILILGVCVWIGNKK